MKKSEWSDHELEQLLQQMPKIKDHRDPRDIYQSLSLKTKKRRAPAWIVPSVATLAAVLLLFILAPQVWQGNFQDSALKQESKDVLDNSDKMEMTKIMPDDDTKNGISSGHQDISIMAAPAETAIYEEELDEQQVITYTIPDQNAQIFVPVSVLVPKNSSWVELYQSQAEKLTEEQWGLSDYFPLNATLSMIDEKTMNIDVPEDHVYGNGSANETLFISILEETISRNENLQKITFSTNGNPGIMLGNYGERFEVNKPETKKKSYFIFRPNTQNSPFIVPGIEGFSDIAAALESMRAGNVTYGLEPSIPAEFVFDINVSSQEQLVLTFTGEEQLLDESKYVYCIEAILLTAKEFGYKSVKFENSPITQIGRFNMENEIKVPVAPNKVILH
ncbi:negative regulator of sigma-X activity [Pseudoneobacillus rhizosphaerae]|uniref:Anti-sigma-X factor RsiX n=1 Tax=Pseudoneobacillus rhizosphaerae TaxID=2880968 RepID=A0A9C7G9E8_9BACI|nr:negative regulator of sigma-X activity [Pseudoneobacillus rhizosphaerae]CAG9608349.1 Anti-sigma-X factor RsiX [Pseudoneobacillus rhizosphaerae]